MAHCGAINEFNKGHNGSFMVALIDCSVETIQAEFQSSGGATDGSPGRGCEADAARGNRPNKPTFSSFAPVKGE